jgi:acyl-homoserine lactone acylase PvdQ
MKLGQLAQPAFPLPADVPSGQRAAYTSALAMLTQWQADGYGCPTGLTGASPASAADPDPVRARDSAACLLFHATWIRLLHAVFDDDFAFASTKGGRTLTPELHYSTRAMLAFFAGHPGSTFCNDVDKTTGDVATAHTCQEQLVTALVGASAELTATYGATSNWIWGRVHTVTTKSPADPIVGAPFAAGPFARPGGILTVDVGNPSLSRSGASRFTYGSGSNVRFIAVMNPPASAVTKMQLPGPQREVAYGTITGAPDLLLQYVQNQPFDLLMGHQVDAAVTEAQHFGP